MGRLTHENVEEAFTYQQSEPEQVVKFGRVRDACIALACVILDEVPECADRSVALRKLREVRMDANAAIALKGLI